MKITHTILGLAMAGVLLFSGCKKDPVIGDLALDITYKVDADDLVYNDIRYTNEAGYDFSVTKMVYYISNIRLYGDGIEDFISDEIQYIDASNATSGRITLSEVPFGTYSGMAFTLGVDDARNVTGGLPTSVENNNMAWPAQMGGGYHHMKFEGSWRDSTGSTSGFAMHLGLNGNQSQCTQNRALNFSEDGQVHTLTMNLNEWFRSPAVYDFAVDGTSIMSNAASMQKLARNGDDAFDN